MKLFLIAIGILMVTLIPSRASEAEMISSKTVARLNSILESDSPKPIEIKIVKSQDEIEAKAEREKKLAAKKASFVVKPQIERREPIPRGDYSSCVLYIERVTGVNPGIIGVARNWPVNSNTPKVGSILISNESRAGHASLIIGIEGGNLILDEANYVPNQHTTGRKLSINSPLIIGYYIY